MKEVLDLVVSQCNSCQIQGKNWFSVLIKDGPYYLLGNEMVFTPAMVKSVTFSNHKVFIELVH